MSDDDPDDRFLPPFEGETDSSPAPDERPEPVSRSRSPEGPPPEIVAEPATAAASDTVPALRAPGPAVEIAAPQPVSEPRLAAGLEAPPVGSSIARSALATPESEPAAAETASEFPAAPAPAVPAAPAAPLVPLV